MQQNINKYLSATTIPNIILIHSNIEEYSALMEYTIEQIRNKINKTCTYKFIVDLGFNYSELKPIISNGSLFNDIIYIELNYSTTPNTEHQKQLATLMHQLDATIFLIITTNKLSPTDLKSIWIQQIIQQSGWIINLVDSDAVNIVRHQLHTQQLEIKPNALELLLTLNQGNYTQLIQDIKRISLLFTPPHTLTTDDIKQQSIDNSIYNIYQLNTAYLSGDFSKSIKIFNNIYQNTEDAILLLWLLYEDIRKLIQIKDKVKRQITFNTACQELRIWQSQIKLYSNANQRISYTTLVGILNELSQIDLMLKGVLPNNVRLHFVQILKTFCNKIVIR